MEPLAKVRTDGRASEHNRCLGSDGPTESDGDGTGQHTRPAVVGTDSRTFAGDGIQYLGDSMTDVVTHHMTDKQ